MTELRIVRTALETTALSLSMALLLPGAARAQDDDAPADDVAEAEAEGAPIVVTGSRIASGLNEPNPVQIVGAARLDQRGSANIGEAIEDLSPFRIQYPKPSQNPARKSLLKAKPRFRSFRQTTITFLLIYKGQQNPAFAFVYYRRQMIK